MHCPPFANKSPGCSWPDEEPITPELNHGVKPRPRSTFSVANAFYVEIHSRHDQEEFSSGRQNKWLGRAIVGGVVVILHAGCTTSPTAIPTIKQARMGIQRTIWRSKKSPAAFLLDSNLSRGRS
jgi:hypothetical protein